MSHIAESLKSLVEAVASTSPIAIMMTATRHVVDEGGLTRQMAIILIPSIITAALTSGVTAWATQQVMSEQIKEVKEQVQYNRDVDLKIAEKLQDSIARDHDQIMRIEARQDLKLGRIK